MNIEVEQWPMDFHISANHQDVRLAFHSQSLGEKDQIGNKYHNQLRVNPWLPSNLKNTRPGALDHHFPNPYHAPPHSRLHNQNLNPQVLAVPLYRVQDYISLSEVVFPSNIPSSNNRPFLHPPGCALPGFQ